MLRKAAYVGVIGLVVAVIGLWTLQKHLVVGPIVLAMSFIPMVGLLVARRSPVSALPDFLFGAIDTGLLTIPALGGGLYFGFAGVIAGAVIGDAVTDAIAGFFEGGVAAWLHKKGIDTAREPLTTGLGKMAGCLFGSGLVLTLALLLGIQPDFH